MDTTFVKPEVEKSDRTVTEDADSYLTETTIKVALDKTGFLELIEWNPPVEKEGLSNIHFKVPDLEQAKAEMKRQGIRLVEEIIDVNFKEAVFHSDDLCGVTLCLVEYNANDLLDLI